MSLRLGDTAPDFEQDSSEGRIDFHDWLGNSWGILFSHPANINSDNKISDVLICILLPSLF